MKARSRTPTPIASTTRFASRATTATICSGFDDCEPGERVTAADGYGRWRRYVIVTARDGVLDLRATSAFEHEASLDPGLAVAPSLTKGDRPELVVQQLTELGVDRIVVVEAARSVVRWDDNRAAVAMQRLARVAREAGAQSRRARLPGARGPGRAG